MKKINFIKKGFTLTEVVVAVAIFSIGVLGVFSFFAYATQINRASRSTTTATNLAQGIMDQKINATYNQLTPGTGTKTRYSSDQANPFYNYQTQTNITLLDSNLNATATDVGLKQIEVKVFWQEGTTEKNVSLKSIITRK